MSEQNTNVTDVVSSAVGTEDAPIHLEPTSSPQGSLTAPRPDDGTFNGAHNTLDVKTGKLINPAPTDGPVIREANVSTVAMPLSA